MCSKTASGASCRNYRSFSGGFSDKIVYDTGLYIYDKMYVLSKQDANSAVTSSDLQAGSQLTKDYMELIKSRSVMEQVISQLQLDMSVDKLSGEITVSNTADTRILSIPWK